MVFAIVLVLGMAALAIDVATLYLAKSEAQRAADAAALAAAKAFIVAAVTTAPGDPTAQNVAIDLAQQQANAVIQQSNIAGRPGQLVPPLASNPVFSFGSPTFVNPTVQVSVEQTGLPTFFARIWRRAPSSVSATAIAEAYNPSGVDVNPAVSVQCVKPFIVPNMDPVKKNGANFQFLDPTSGAIVRPGRYNGSTPGVVGETIRFQLVNTTPTIRPLNILEFVPANLPSGTSGTVCPGCSTGSTQFEQDIACCNTTALACQGSTIVTADLSGTATPAMLTSGLQCMIHKSPGLGMDSLDPNGFPLAAGPFRFVAGPNNPLVTGPNPVVRTSQLVSTSDSLITLLIYDGNSIVGGGAVNILGFMQVFVNDEGVGGAGTFDATVLNISGCGNTVRPTTVTGGGASPIAVRLIHN
jgi:hypothetical protein